MFRAAQRAMLAPCHAARSMPIKPLSRLPLSPTGSKARRDDDIHPVNPAPSTFRPGDMSVEELIAWAWEHRRADILAKFGIYVGFNP
jgi:hypothetical protein